MPMDFLRRIENAAFPLTVDDATDVRCAAVLAAAELIAADLPEPSGSVNLPAVILGITAQGRAELRRLRTQG